MANKCWNQFSFYGNKKVMERVTTWSQELDVVQPTSNDPYCMRAVFEVFYPGRQIVEVSLGSKWVHPELGLADKGEIGLVSAWESPDDLQDYLTLELFKLDPLVVVRNSYNTESFDFGCRYTTAYDLSNVYCQEAFVNETDLDEEVEPEEKYEALAEQLLALEIEALENLLDDMPGRAKKLKKPMKHLSINWDDYE
jgi:hypothetical protein